MISVQFELHPMKLGTKGVHSPGQSQQLTLIGRVVALMLVERARSAPTQVLLPLVIKLT
jgi:hypothetical protein